MKHSSEFLFFFSIAPANGSRISLISVSLISQPLREILKQERLIEHWLAAGQQRLP